MKRRSKAWVTGANFLLATGVALACGCASNGDSAGARANADQPSDNGKSPAITVKTRIAAGELAESRNAPTYALEQYHQALKLEPANRVATYRVAMIYTNLHDYARAEPAWNQYIAATADSADGFSDLGLCCELAGSKADAEAAYRKGIARDEKNANCRVNFGLMLARSGRIKESLDQLQSVLSPAEAHYNLASVYEQQGHRDLARLEYKTALDLDPNMNDARVRLVRMETDAGG
jgi:tetratricopeptide (TPR) repeat protein